MIEATGRAGKIRNGLAAFAVALDSIEVAYRERDWETLGYDDWSAYANGEFGYNRLRIPKAKRAEMVGRLSDSMSTRGIASVLGLSQSTVTRELAGESKDSADPKVKGTDGKAYTRRTQRPQAPAPKRRTLADGLASVAADFTKLPLSLSKSITIGAAGAVPADPNMWDVRVPAELRTGAGSVADQLENWAGDLQSLARLLREAARP